MPIDYKNTLTNLMGIPADSSDDVIANSVSQFQSEMVQYKELTDGDMVRLENSTRQLTADNERLTNSNTALLNTNKTLTEQLVNGDMEKFKGVITNTDAVRAMLLNNREVGLAFLNGLKLTNAAPEAPVAPAAPKAPKPAPLHNSAVASQPAPVTSAAPVQTEEFAIKVTNRARELMNSTKGMGWNQAFLNARSEIEGDLQKA